MAQISIAAIKVEERLRAVDPDWADYLAESIQASGLLQPVVVTRDGQQGFKLIDGAHRLAAVQSLNWVAIEARVLEMAETERRLAEVDANLVRRDLNYIDRGRFLAERRSLVTSLHGVNLQETNENLPCGQNVPERIVRREFDRRTAEKLGISERQVRYLASFHEHIAPDLCERLSSTAVGNRPTELKALCRLRPALQREVVARLTDPGTPARSVREALAELGERPVPAPRSERLFSAAKAAAARLDAKGQARFIAWLRELGWI
jgi:ParB family chromosome partitioning protein